MRIAAGYLKNDVFFSWIDKDNSYVFDIAGIRDAR
jgi:hypothetical protein